MNYDFKKKKVLIIDDDQPMIDIVVTLLNRCNAVASGVSDPDRAISLAGSGKFSLIVLDRHMPSMDGLDVLKALKENKLSKHTPVLMLSGVKDEKEILRSIKEGVQGYVGKPFQPKMFLMQVDKILNPHDNKDNDDYAVDV